jgi:branched-chain amino acid transport system substrate-binding protein
MANISRRVGSFGFALAALLAGAAGAQDDTVTIGFAVARTGANATGVGITTIPNCELWVHTVNEAGGLQMPDGSRRRIEVVEYDNRSSNQDLVRGIERLAIQDEVDLILPPSGTGANLAIAALMARDGSPQLALTAVTDKAPVFVERWDRSFWMLDGGHNCTEGLVDALSAARDAGQIKDKVAVVSFADGFGIDLINSAGPAFAAAGFEPVHDET